MLSRRTILTGAALAGAGAVASHPLWQAAAAPEPQLLKIPDLIDARKEGQSLALKVQTGTTAFFPGRDSRTFGYNGNYLGPVIRVHRGDDVEIAVTNALSEATTVHWHGLLIPGEMDGGPHQLIRPGTTWRPVVSVRQPAATLFYHSHVHDRTAEQVYSGLTGVLIVTEDSEKALGLPSEYGVDDLPLVLQDRQFEDGRLVVPQGMMSLMMGRRGDTLLVNGTPNPVARVPRRLARLRFVNGSNARIFNLAFSDDRAFHWIASEGGLLERPVELRSLTLAPGERAEILADFSDGRPVALETGADLNMPMMMGMQRRLRSFFSDLLGRSREHILRFEPQGGASGTKAAVPERLAEHERVDAAQAVRRRRFVLNMGMGGMMGGRGGMMGGDRGSGMAMHGINSRAFDMKRIDEQVRLGDIEIWEASGEMMAHPLHIHGVHFEVLSRDGGKPTVRDQGLRDTVLVKEPVELLARFTQAATKAPFMYHCHILEHEDNGMMGQFTVG
ncbi:multicopper oxidase family protein [Rhodoplanes roseus]|uniref:Multicopper oxidase CueO n=1 Tax=Rhodoplanes roseus TaxID=29409 RepID=A0A327L8F6_9BRAD|nr:multicopper oxidase domain-containing protein [Rhodoplanes roseus]RAI46183.1 copper oxidase [Rhodoplanes roseus]